MANKDLYVYTVKMDNDGNMEIQRDWQGGNSREPDMLPARRPIACMASGAGHTCER